jgi:hypothetical protein
MTEKNSVDMGVSRKASSVPFTRTTSSVDLWKVTPEVIISAVGREYLDNKMRKQKDRRSFIVSNEMSMN